MIEPLEIPDVLLIRPKVHGDERGFFTETYNKRALAEAGLTADFVQDNHSRSGKGVLRGLHYQLQRPQGKLVRVVTGTVFDVAVVEVHHTFQIHEDAAADRMAPDCGVPAWVTPR